MKNFSLILSLFLALSVVMPNRAHAMNSKTKAFMLISLYGTVGGGLLGLSSIAFGSEGRNVWKGMSIGLYLGMAFGGYVVASHKYKVYKSTHPDAATPYYDDAVSPYGDDDGFSGFDGGGSSSDAYQDDPQEQPAQRISRLRLTNNLEEKFELKKDRKSLPLYIHLLDYRF